MKPLTLPDTLTETSETVPFAEKPKNLLRNPLYLAGLGSLLLSLVLLTVSGSGTNFWRNNFFENTFFINFGISVVYFIFLFGTFRFKMFRQTPHFLLWLLLAFVSCFALNRSLPVFQETTPWLTVYLCISGTALVLYAFQPFLPKMLHYLTFFLLGTGAVVYVYYAVYLFPLYPLSVVAVLFFGLSLHSFVPLFLSITIIFIIIYQYRQKNPAVRAFWLGLGLPLAFALYFGVQYYNTSMKVLSLYNQTQLQVTEDLPAWVRVSQQLPDDWITERVLKTDLVFEQAPYGLANLNFGFPSRSFEDIRQHDPLVVMGSVFVPRAESLGWSERIKILEARHDARHQTQERLWSGKDLTTASVLSNIRLYPQYRLAYTEKTLQIASHATQQWSKQEAIYTFRLPEGSVVTSLSLWINGKEEPAYLTTKSKADSAYKTVVGVESRDPSVVHWQEGNTVSVRVFPCTPAENRKFKIGITSPLRKEGDKLVFENPYFQGPSPMGSPETVQVIFDKPARLTDAPMDFKAENGKIYHEGFYQPAWKLTVQAVPLDKTPFTFDGKSYAVADYQPDYEAFMPENVYLDVNENWSEAEFNQVWEAVKVRPVFVYQGGMTQVTEENKTALFRNLHSLKFSLFPLHLLPHPETSLLISKGVANSPALHDLSGSPFADKLTAFLENHRGIRLYNLGSELSPFLKALKEFRVFVCDSGDAGKLADLLKKRQFVSLVETKKQRFVACCCPANQRKPAGRARQQGNSRPPAAVVCLQRHPPENGSGLLQKQLHPS